jgi:hypothetical protein
MNSDFSIQQVQQLNEAFAFLTGQIREEMRLNENEALHETLRAVAPALLAPVPASALVDSLEPRLSLNGFAFQRHPDFPAAEKCELATVALRQEPACDLLELAWKGAGNPLLFVKDWELWRFLVEHGEGIAPALFGSDLFCSLRDFFCAPALARFVRLEGQESALVRFRRRLPAHLAAQFAAQFSAPAQNALRANVAWYENRFLASAEPVFLKPQELPGVPIRYPLASAHEILAVAQVVALSSRRMGLRSVVPFRYLFGKLAVEGVPPLCDTLSVELECCDGSIAPQTLLQCAGVVEAFPFAPAPLFSQNFQEMAIQTLRSELEGLAQIDTLRQVLRFLAAGASREWQEQVEVLQSLESKPGTALVNGLVVPSLDILVRTAQELPQTKALELALQGFFTLKSPLNTKVRVCLSA